jgi:hypothetical protein
MCGSWGSSGFRIEGNVNKIKGFFALSIEIAIGIGIEIDFLLSFFGTDPDPDSDPEKARKRSFRLTTAPCMQRSGEALEVRSPI